MAILTCTCNHKFQDKRYGRKKRVMNPKGDRKMNMFSCTVCGKERAGNAGTATKRKEDE